MNYDIFGRLEGSNVYAYTADQVELYYSTSEVDANTSAASLINDAKTKLSLFLTDVDINYSQTVTTVHELGTLDRAFIAARPSGTGKLTHLIGPKNLQATMLKNLGNVCNIAKNHMYFVFDPACAHELSSSTSGSNEAKDMLSLKWVCATEMNVAVSNRDFLITDRLDIMFAYLTLNNGNQSTT